ncbi:MAG: nitrous oxide reductase family maturation protein NosD [Planctomycetes bacterium]|nr:nitrous oxide reductase family maturation protein NosD [Planctomycetota bacterium]
MDPKLENILGPRVPATELKTHRGRYILPTVLLLAAGLVFGASYTLSYWSMTLHAPQYPKGLHVQAYLNRLTGDVKEIDGLNHYIGMRPLNDAAQFERQTSAMMIGVLALLLVAAIFIHNKWAALAALPALVFPVGFLADLQYWLASFGTNLDPHAALSKSIKPFVPPVLGVGTIGQFKTVADPGPGFWVACVGALIVLIALWSHRRAYKPLVDAKKHAPRQGAATVASILAIGFGLLLAPRNAAADVGSSFDLAAQLAVAAPGATLHVPQGVYRGPFEVAKPLTLIAEGAVVLDGGGEGDVLRISAPDVTVRGFALRGTGTSLDRQNAGISVKAERATIEDNKLDDVLIGISLSGARDSIVRRNYIHGKPLILPRRGDAIRLWSSDRARVEDNVVVAARDMVVWYSQRVQLRRNRVTDSRYGTHFMYASDGLVEDNEFVDNSVGVFLMYSHDVVLRRNLLDRNRGPSGYGIGLKDMDGVVIEDNVVSGNRMGLYVDNSPSRMDGEQTFRRNVFAYNDVGLGLLPAVQRNRFVDNAFLENVEQVAVLGTGELKNNAFSLNGRGNYWSDYAGFDADGDGVGDVHYRAMSLFENMIDREPLLRMFLYSPAQPAIELASRAFPIVRPQPKITDQSPLMRSPIPPGSPRQAATTPLGVVSAALLGVSGLLAGAWRRRESPRESHRAAGPIDGGRISAASTDRLGSTARPSAAGAPAAPASAATGARSIISIRGLHKRFGRNVVVDRLDLDVAAGSALALWGTNGAGKTTIIKCILGLHRFDGSISVDGVDCRRDGKAARRRIGYVSQELCFYDDLTACDSVRLFAQLKRVATSRADEVLAQVGLTEHRKKRVGELSGGMKQRLALAVALLADPPILLLDEPTSNLDAAARRQFFELLVGLKKAGKTLLFTTHRAEEVAGLADRVIWLEHGRIRCEGAADTLDAGCRLRIPLPAEQRQAAHHLLTNAGFTATGNGVAVYVQVPPARKAEPIALLARAGIVVTNFEVESGEPS